MLSSIGEGAFGEVSLAACTIFGRVAVKWLKVQLQQLHGGFTVQRTPHLLHVGCTQASCCSPASQLASCFVYSCVCSRAIVVSSMSAPGARQPCFHEHQQLLAPLCMLHNLQQLSCASSELWVCLQTCCLYPSAVHAAQLTSSGDSPAAGQGGAAQPELLARSRDAKQPEPPQCPALLWRGGGQRPGAHCSRGHYDGVYARGVPGHLHQVRFEWSIQRTES